MATSAERVFGIAELLEAILLPVDMKTLLLSQRVNTTFRDTISTSPALLESLYFRQTQAPLSSGYRDPDSIRKLVNTLLVRRTDRAWEWGDLPSCVDAVTGAKILCRVHNVNKSGHGRRLHFMVRERRLEDASLQREGDIHVCNDYPKASWQRMYLIPSALPADMTQIAVETWLHRNRRGQTQDNQDWHTTTSAMTLGEIYEQVMRCCYPQTAQKACLHYGTWV
ncbi:hypothetical protein LTR56_019233 [Elasticomyces elasticus]|nr:hypothetical protein LTR56_019233 [Elasticomyces elasticus]KAK3633241.1 hypothetical protein LTR22_020241 [Elasticomyces elasticus]KAK4910599.1 hypothetical protein LTR49_020731 [Elasticomyces elasticus]KAK5751010.1 hypothetical protein LTS12_018911 [Elasticomyces elasticus]